MGATSGSSQTLARLYSLCSIQNEVDFIFLFYFIFLFFYFFILFFYFFYLFIYLFIYLFFFFSKVYMHLQAMT
jgi:hypothetical protein